MIALEIRAGLWKERVLASRKSRDGKIVLVQGEWEWVALQAGF